MRNRLSAACGRNQHHGLVARPGARPELTGRETLLQIMVTQTEPITGGAQGEPLTIAQFCHSAYHRSSHRLGIEYPDITKSPSQVGIVDPQVSEARPLLSEPKLDAILTGAQRPDMLRSNSLASHLKSHVVWRISAGFSCSRSPHRSKAGHQVAHALHVDRFAHHAVALH